MSSIAARRGARAIAGMVFAASSVALNVHGAPVSMHGAAPSETRRSRATARADGGAPFSLVTEVSCDPLPGPGKVQCSIRVRPVGGALQWSDAIVVAAPSFAAPLRTRVASGDAKRNEVGGVEFSLALAATGDGVGELKVLARGAVCGDGGCRPVQAEGAARVAVGATVRSAGGPYQN